MRALLDVNVLIALLDADHSLHARAIEWFADGARDGWASCPITQNGCARVMSHPGYPNALPVRAVMERLEEATASSFHEFWPDDISLLDARIADSARIHGPRQLTDVYLLALAVRHGGRFVTFDASVSLDAVRGAEKNHMLAL
jgi:toxin-antitoxin system PIN domain toxin